LFRRIVLGLSCIILAFAFTSNQFWIPVELEVVQDEEFDSTNDVNAEHVITWKFTYGGFKASQLPNDRLTEGNNNDNDGTIYANTGEDNSVYIRSLIHVIVGATKFTILRYLIAEAELTVKMLIDIMVGINYGGTEM